MNRVYALILLGASALIVWPVGAEAAEMRQLPPLPVRQTEKELEKLGCDLQSAWEIESGKSETAQRPVIGSDATGENLAYCSPEQVGQLTVISPGQVAGVADFFGQEAQAYPITPSAIALGFAAGKTIGQTISGTDDPTDQGILAAIKALPGRMLSLLESAADSTLSTVFQILGELAAWLLGIVIKGAVVPLLIVGQFVTSPVVTALWPTVLVIANMGFLLALVLIALFTTLRIESGGARRMLPRLLVAALLVNFSLVVAGVIIDFSRLLMAGLAAALLPSQATDFGEYLSANLIDSVFYQNVVENGITVRRGLQELIAKAAYDSGLPFNQTIGYGVGMLVLWLAFIGALVLTFQLMIRYLALLILVILSPLAYLFVAFPNTGNLARKWWSMFLHYVFFAPVVLFLLLGIVQIGNVTLFQQSAGNFWVLIIKPILLGAAFYGAAKAGTYAGVAGSAAAIGFATRGGRRAVRGAGRGAGVAAGVAYVGTPAQRMARSAREFGRQALRPARKKRGVGEYSKFDKQGRLKPGESTRLSRLGERIGRSAEDRTAVEGIKAASAQQTRLGARYHPAADRNLSVENLSNKAAVTQLSRSQIADINLNGTDQQRAALSAGLGTSDRLSGEQLKAVAQTGDSAQLRSIVNNVNIVSSANSGQRSDLIKRALELGRTGKGDAQAIMDTLFRTVDRAKRAAEK